MPEIDEQPVLSRAAYERLKAEYEELTTAGRRGVAERLKRARELGDLKENAEYDETKNEQGMMEARIRKVEYMIKRAQIVDAPVSSDEVVPGMIVTLLAPGDDDPETYLVAATPEERAPGARTVSVKSPLGQALVGKRIGETVAYEAPGGTFTYTLTEMKPFAG